MTTFTKLNWLSFVFSAMLLVSLATEDIHAQELLSQNRVDYKNLNTGVKPRSFQKLRPDSFKKKTLEHEISGTVKDNNGEPLPGVNIVIKGTTIGTLTNVDGKFTLTVPDDRNTLVFSSVGYVSQEVNIQGLSIVDITLMEDVSRLDEIVVIGLGETKKREDLTGSIVSVGSEVIEKTAYLSPQFALQGQTPGVRIVNTSGDPNAQPRVQIRGIGTWNGNAQPLYVIDGQIINEVDDFGNQDVVAGNGRITPLNLWNLVNPQDIESISVLKDASAAAIYGSRAANGVILITTRKGKIGAPVVELNTQVGISTVPTEDRMLNTQQWVNLVREAFSNSTDPNTTLENDLYGRDIATNAERLRNFTPQMDPTSPFYIDETIAGTYDHQDHLLRTALDQAYNIKVSGASEKMNYYVSVGYKDQEHPHVGNNNTRYTAAVNLNFDIKPWLRAGINYKYANSVNTTREANFPALVNHAPWQPLLAISDAESNAIPLYAESSGFAHVIAPPDSAWEAIRIYGQASVLNRLARQEIGRSEFRTNRNLAQGFIEVKPLEGLSIRGSLNLDLTDQTRVNINEYFLGDVSGEVFSPGGLDPTTLSPNAPNSVGSLGERRNTFFNYQADLFISYQRLFGKHSVGITIGAQDTYREGKVAAFSGGNIQQFRDVDRTGFGNDLENNNAFVGYRDAFWFGYVARGSYNYDSKYYVDFSFRRDASSGFAEDFRWGNFYSISGAWRISQENFMESVEFVNELKLRAGYGEAGNDEAAVGNFAYLSTVASSGSVRFGSGNGDPLGIYNTADVINDFPNTTLSWETGITVNIGVDARLFNNRLSFTGEVYRRTTIDILQRASLSPSLGLRNPLLNLGELRNDGIDLDIGWDDNIGDFTFGIGLNASFLRNKITKLFLDQPFFVNNGLNGISRIEVGRSIGHIWGYVVGGIYQSQSEIDARNGVIDDQSISDINFVAPGDIFFQDLGGNPTDDEPFYSTSPDSLLNAFDRTEIGNTLPNLTFGINLSASWKGFDLSLSFYGESGAERINNYRRGLELMGGAGANQLNTTLSRWTSSNPSTSMPRAIAGDPAGNNRQFSTRWLESTAFLRLNNWQLGYTVPQSLLGKLNGTISYARIFVGGQNNILITNWSGLDPVNDAYPLPRTLIFGLNLKF